MLDEGGYTRYDFNKTPHSIRRIKEEVRWSLWKLYNSSKDSRDLERKLKALGKGVGDTTVSIFLRDMRLIWEKADPKPTPLVELAMKHLPIKDLKAFAVERGLNKVKLEKRPSKACKRLYRKGESN